MGLTSSQSGAMFFYHRVNPLQHHNITRFHWVWKSQQGWASFALIFWSLMNHVVDWTKKQWWRKLLQMSISNTLNMDALCVLTVG
jgi:hypothetical protein